MTPDGWGSALAFLLFVAPGIIFDLLSRSRRVGAEESTFREISRVALFSLLLSLVAAVPVGLVAARIPIVLSAVSSVQSGELVWLSGQGAALVGLALAQLALSSFLACGLHALLKRFSHGQDIVLESQWTRVFRRDCPPNHDMYLRAKMTSGAVWTGRLLGFSPDLELDHRELVLGPPMRMRGADKDTPSVEVPSDFDRLVLRGNEIVSMLVQYEPGDAVVRPGKALWTAWRAWWQQRPRSQNAKQGRAIPTIHP